MSWPKGIYTWKYIYTFESICNLFNDGQIDREAKFVKNVSVCVIVLEENGVP